MKLAAYAKYKPSNIDWAGDVPADWSLKRVREGAKLINGYPFDSDLFGIGEGLPLVRIRDIASNTTEVTWTGPAIRSARIERGDILVGMDGDFNVARWTGNSAMLNQRVCCVRTKPTELDDRFLFYFLPFPLKTLNDVTYSTTVKHLSSLDLLKFRFYAPNVREQRAIADFLDRETARLDTLVGKKRELIEKLKEKRTALISGTVTHGLNATAKLKPSGIEWLGDIPSGWEVKSFRHAMKGGTRNGLYKSSEYSDPDGTPIIQMGEAFAFPIIQKTADDRLRLTAQEKETWGLQKNDLLFARRSLVFEGSGKCSMVGDLPELHVFESSLIRVRPRSDRLGTRFLFWFIRSAFSRAQILAITKQVTISGLDTQQLKAIAIVIPPRAEQTAIADYLDRETAKIDKMIEKVEGAIQKLLEYRTALISAAVTGKIDVRNGPKSAVST